MIVIYIKSLPDTWSFMPLVEDLDCTLLINPSREEVEKVLTENPTDDVMCFGHGSPLGLFTPNWQSYIIDEKNVHLLSNRKKVIGIWCHALNFAQQHNLKGFFTNMFISNKEESQSYNFENYNYDDIFLKENSKFATEVNKLIKDNIDISQWKTILCENSNKDLKFVQYNYKNLTIL